MLPANHDYRVFTPCYGPVNTVIHEYQPDPQNPDGRRSVFESRIGSIVQELKSLEEHKTIEPTKDYRDKDRFLDGKGRAWVRISKDTFVPENQDPYSMFQKKLRTDLEILKRPCYKDQLDKAALKRLILMLNGVNPSKLPYPGLVDKMFDDCIRGERPILDMLNASRYRK